MEQAGQDGRWIPNLRPVRRTATQGRMRRALLVLLLATSSALAAPEASPEASPTASPAASPSAEPAAPRPAGPHDAHATSLLEKIVAGPDAATRTAAIDELMKLAPTTIGALDAWLSRPHTSTIEERRAVLEAIEADVPDEKGRFTAPKRQTSKERQADDDLDWLTKLLALDPSMPGVGEVIADDVAIRALSSTRDIIAAQMIFEAGFRDETMIMRDECGRYLRKMEPYSIPALTLAAQGKGTFDRRRYANYQLERVDRQEPLKALAAAEGDESLMIAILDAFRTTLHREAVHAVWKRVDDPRPRVREAARAAWMHYIAGPPPKPAPTKKLQLPGGKLTKEEKPLWLTYRELADNELRLASNELLHTDYPIEDPMSLDDRDTKRKIVKINLVDVTNQLFAYYDGERAKQDAAQWEAAKAKADGGDLEGAITMLDRLLAQNPERADRAGMAPLYFRYAKQLEAKQQWNEAATAYSKAHGLDPTGKTATDALAAHHYTLGKALEAQGKDGGPDFRRAIALKPGYAPAEDAAEIAETGGAPSRPTWMLYAAILTAGIAGVLFAAGMKRRRA
jgi:tetratricopeptide (TPR) repeat protein